MLVSELASSTFTPPKTTSTVQDALKIIDGYKLTHVPVFNGLTFVGNLSDEDLENMDLNEPLSNAKDFYEYFFVTENSTVFDAVNLFYANSTNMIPVLDNDEKYMGAVLMEDTIALLSRLPLISEPSALLTVSIPVKQYSLAEVAKIVESNNGRLFGAFISNYTEDQVEITLRFNAESLTSVTETFERFGYKITYRYFNDEKQNLYNDRYNQLMKYLDM